jgi:predicted nucleotidyltransferase
VTGKAWQSPCAFSSRSSPTHGELPPRRRAAVAFAMSFPDIACRAKAVVIDDVLGITVDGKAARSVTATAAGATAVAQSSNEAAVADACGGPSSAASAQEHVGDAAGPAAAAPSSSPPVQSGFLKSLQVVRQRAEPRTQGAGFDGDFISFDSTAAGSARAELDEGPRKTSQPSDGKKRKRGKQGEGGGESAAALQVDKRSPWARGRRYQSHEKDRTVDLHNEMLDFVAFIKPTKSEIKRRETLVDLCCAMVSELWPMAKLEVFGSYASGMYLPSSDIDMVVMGCPEKNPFSLRKLAAVIKADENFDKIQVIEKARVPIIKWEDVPSGIPLNVCFEQRDGLTNTAWVKEQMIALQPLQPLLLVLKQFLYNRDLHETYTGGVGSYLLTMTIISFLQHHPGRGPDFKKPENNLGALLMDYLHLYGLRFNMERMGISSRSGGMYFEKDSIGWDE